MKRLSVFILAMTLLIGLIAPLGVNAAGFCGDLPATVTVNLAQPWTTAYFETTISGDGFLNGTYDGWCIDLENEAIVGPDFDAKVVCSYDPEAAGYVNWPDNLDSVNWILNQDFIGQTAPDGSIYHWQDVQMAFWRLLEVPGYEYHQMLSWTEARVSSITTAALASGGDFTPGSGDLCAIILVPVDEAGQIVGQINIIALARTGGEGCTPGYWKNNWDKWDGVSWGPTDYRGGNLFSAVFGRTIEVTVGRRVYTNPTLFQALNAQGGGINALARHAVAALLNADSPEVDYDYDVAAVISMVQGAMPDGDIDGVKDDLADANEAGCPIDMHGNPIVVALI